MLIEYHDFLALTSYYEWNIYRNGTTMLDKQEELHSKQNWYY